MLLTLGDGSGSGILRRETVIASSIVVDLTGAAKVAEGNSVSLKEGDGFRSAMSSNQLVR